MFLNRKQTGTLLASKIAELQIAAPVIIAIPRGGVEVAGPIALKLHAPLYVIPPRKIGAPFNPEFAVGALAPDGTISFDERILDYFGLEPKDLQSVIEKEQTEIKKRLELYEDWGILPDLTDHSIILVDDGIATGQTVKAALYSLKKKTANPIVLAVPVLPYDAVNTFEKLVDHLVYLEAPCDFQAVGQFFQDFSDLPHQEVISILDTVNNTT